MSPTFILFFILWQLVLPPQTFHHRKILAAAAAGGGKWDLLRRSIGISAMHMQLLHNDKVVVFDRTDFGLSNISLPDGKCRRGMDKVVGVDCSAHSVEYDVVSNSVRPLMVLSDVWCSSGSVSPAGTLVQTGGYGKGDRIVRLFDPCEGAKCDWLESRRRDGLIRYRWYSTNHKLPDGRQIIIGGRSQFNYEFYPKTPGADRVYYLRFLNETSDPFKVENNLYPFLFLNVDGHLFIFANNRAILLDYTKNVVVRTYPVIPDGHPRNYPSTGSAVLLPLKNLNGAATKAEVLICGGSPRGGYQNAKKRRFVGALNTCGRITISDPNPVWRMEEMPSARVMGDMVTLPNGQVLIINGAAVGAASWEIADNPVFHPVVYRPDNPIGSRFEVQNPSRIPRMYHSTAVLIRDGRVIVAGSNPHKFYNFTNVLFPTDLSLESFSPSYLDPKNGYKRPLIVSPASQVKLKYRKLVSVEFKVSGPVDKTAVKVTMVSPSFNTHSFSMNQRLLILNAGKVKPVGEKTFKIDVVTPGSPNLAPPGYYLLFVVHQEIPSKGIWVHIQ